MKLKTIAILGSVLIISGTMAVVGAQNMGTAQFSLDGGSKGEINFPHSLHQETLNDCQVCHGTFPMEPGVILKMKNKNELKKQQVMNKVCLACHKQNKAEGKKYGPVKCNDCHSKS